MKIKFLKFIPILIVVILLGWSISSKATDDIKSATANFSVIGTVGSISEDGITITDAKGSDKSGKTSYDLNIKYLEETEMNTYIPLNFTDIKTGDKIIAQGLTNGDTFFIKRIISFTSTPTPVLPKDEVATTTAATSTATTTEDIATSTVGGPEDISASSTSSNTNESTSTATTTSEIEGTTTPADTATTTSDATSTPSILETVTDVVQGIVETITDTVQTVVDAVTGGDSSSDSPTPTE